MAKAAKTAEVTTYCKMTPIGRRRLDPYNSIYVNLEEFYVVDSNFAQYLSDMGEAEIVEEGVAPPWEVIPPPEPVVAKTFMSPATKDK